MSLRRLILTMLAAAALALVVTSVAPADNYGCVSKAQCKTMEKLIRKQFGWGWQGDKALQVARCESGLNPRAANWRDTRGGSFGLFQINGTWGPGGYATEGWIRKMIIPKHNIAMAWRISRGGRSWGAWACA